MNPTRPIRVADYMSANVITFSPDMPVLDAIHELVTHRISGAPVIDDRGDLCGVLTERDCLKLAMHSGYYGDEAGNVREFMTADVVTVPPEMNIVDAAQKFLDLPYRRYPVVDESRLVGIISRRDILRGLLKQR